MTVKVEQFGGIAPRQHPTLLADGMAVEAMNVKLESGKLVPLREPLEWDSLTTMTHLENGLRQMKKARSLHLWRRADGDFDFVAFPGMTWMAVGNVADDELTRIVVSGDTGAQFVDADGKTWQNCPAVWLRDAEGVKRVVGICKKPISAAPKISRASSTDLSTGIVRYTRFFVTWVDKYGMESPVSPPSQISDGNGGWEDGDLEYLDGDSVQMQKFADVPETAVTVRIYKVVTGTQEGRVQFVKELSSGMVSGDSGSFVFKVMDSDAGEVMPEIENAPADLTCVRNVPGAFYCGFSRSKRKTVCFSDVNLLYSWPEQYRYDIADNIVALAVTSNTVFALTDGWPYALSGTAPESMTVAKLASPAACVSERSVCVFRNAVFYASNAGLMAIANSASEGTIVQNVTEQMFTKDQWQALSPETCLLWHHKGRIYASLHPEGDDPVGLTFNFSEGLSVALTRHDEAVRCCVVDDREDKAYFIREEAQG